jgi:hypothetical protein
LIVKYFVTFLALEPLFITNTIKKYCYIFIVFSIFLSQSSASRLWGIIQKNTQPFIHDYEIIYSQLLEFQLQGNLGNYHDWPYNSNDGWGFVKYTDKNLNNSNENIHSSITAINDPLFIQEIHNILDPTHNIRIAFGHIRNATTGSFSIPNPHPFTYQFNNKTYSFAHNGTIDKIGLLNLLTDNGADSNWINNNPPNSYNCGNWEDDGFNCIVDSELYFLWIMKNIIELNDEYRGIMNAINIIENTNFEIDNINGEQRNFLMSNGMELFAYKSSDDIHEESRYELFYKSFPNHFSIMSTPHSVDSGYIPINDQELLIFQNNLETPISLYPVNELISENDYQILQDFITINNLNEENCNSCNGDGILQPNELGIQNWENNRLIELNLSNYTTNEIKFYPSSIKLLSELLSITAPLTEIIPQVNCSDLNSTLSSFFQCNSFGCSDPKACNYNYFSNENDGSCEYSTDNYDCNGNCVTILNENNLCHDIDNIGCLDTLAYNYNPNAIIDNENCMYDNIILFKRGNNLISLHGIPEIANTEMLMQPLEDAGLEINFILGQGLGYFKVDEEWSGNLHSLDINSGYWFNVGSNFTWHIPLLNRPFLPTDCNLYNLEEGNNLISYTGEQDNFTINSLNGEVFSDNFEFILGQTVGLFYTESGWSGNLFNLKNKKGYWINSLFSMDFYWGTECEESTIIEGLNNKEELKFPFNQSTNQAFYLIDEIIIDNYSPTENDMIIAYYHNQIIGSTYWSADKIIIPIMGRDLSSQTEEYIDEGDIPIIKFHQYKTGKLINLIGDINPYHNLAINQINLLHSMAENIPTNFNLNPAYPNPFNGTTTLNFSLPKELRVKIDLIDITGKKIKSIVNTNYQLGNHETHINGNKLSSGIYLIKLSMYENTNHLFPVYQNTQKIILLK